MLKIAPLCYHKIDASGSQNGITPPQNAQNWIRSSKEKFRQFVERIVSEENTIYIYYASCVKPEVTKEVLKMAGKQSLYEKQLQRIAESMGEEVVERVPPEKRVRGLTLSERLQGLTDEELRSLSPET